MTQAKNIGNMNSLIAKTPEKGNELEEKSPEKKNSDDAPFQLPLPQSPDFLKFVTNRKALTF